MKFYGVPLSPSVFHAIVILVFDQINHELMRTLNSDDYSWVDLNLNILYL